MIFKEDGSIDPDKLQGFVSAVNAIQNPIVYLSIDPGESNGVVGYDKKYHPLFMFTIKHSDMTTFLSMFQYIQKCVMEDYRVFPHMAKHHINSKLITTRVIGRVSSWAETNHIELILQPSNIKPTGYKWIGKRPLPKSNPKNHSLDAHVHFMYYCIKNRLIDLRVLVDKDAKNSVPEHKDK